MRQRLPTVLASGAWLKNCACLFEAGEVRWSVMHGDLGDPQACVELETSLHALVREASHPVAAVAHDLHPDFFSTRLACELAQAWGVPAIGVQHHHAHISAVMAEHALEEPVIGLALDGVGLGTDGTAWGGELLWVSPEGWRHLGGLWRLGLPGGDVAAREPWRMAAAALHAMGRGAEIEPRFSDAVGGAAARTVQQMLATGLRCPETSSLGRWFDAAAAALGLSVRQAHEAQAAMALEQQASLWLASNAPPAIDEALDAQGLSPLDLRSLLRRLLEWPEPQHNAPQAAAWFHVALSQALADWAAAAARASDVTTVCLGGGCFFNAVLRDQVSQRLRRHGLNPLLPRSASCGDAGLAIGQAWVAAHGLRGAPTAAEGQPATSTESVSCA